MNIKIDDIVFTHQHYDPRGDVLYLNTEGYDGYPADGDCTPEGHGMEYDEEGRTVSMTLVNVRWLMERDGDLVITWPEMDRRVGVIRVPPADLLPAMGAAR